MPHRVLLLTLCQPSCETPSDLHSPFGKDTHFLWCLVAQLCTAFLVLLAGPDAAQTLVQGLPGAHLAFPKP